MKNFFENATIICLDGLDCSGKETISNLISTNEKIKKRYSLVDTISFPNYSYNTSRRDLISNLLDKDIYKFHNYGIVKDIDKIIFESRMFYYNIYNGLMNRNYKYSFINENYSNPLFIMDRYWQSNIFYQSAKYLMERFPEDKCINKNSKKILYTTMNTLIYEANMFNFPKVDKYFYIKMPIEFIKYFLEKKKNKDINEENLDYLIYTKSIYDNYIDMIKTYNENTDINIINTEYENKVYNNLETTIKTYTDKKDDRLVYATSINKSYQKLKTTEEIAEEIIDIILED